MSPSASKTWVSVSWPGASSVSFANRCSPGAVGIVQRTIMATCGFFESSTRLPASGELSNDGVTTLAAWISTCAAGADSSSRNGTVSAAGCGFSIPALGFGVWVTALAAVTLLKPNPTANRARERMINRRKGEPRTPETCPGSVQHARNLQMQDWRRHQKRVTERRIRRSSLDYSKRKIRIQMLYASQMNSGNPATVRTEVKTRKKSTCRW